MIDASPAPPAVKQGLIERTLTRWLMHPAVISGVEILSPYFRFIDLEGEGLKDCAWMPGDKIRIKLTGGLITRTYTPIHWNKDRGATRILAHVHGAGPGSDWVSRAVKGASQQILGPQRSLELKNLSAPSLLFGDETSFGLAMALRDSARQNVRFVFEVASLAACRQILDGLGIAPADVIERRADDSHLAEIAAIITRFATEETSFVLSGKAPSIQHVRRVLKKRGVPSRRLKVKAYWAPGKIGLD